jgi:H+/Cl- antiporter ClcA
LNFSRKRNIVKIKRHPLGKVFWNYVKELYLRTLSTNQSLRKQTFQIIPYLIGALITGAVAFLYSRIFSIAEHWSIQLEYSPLSVFLVTPLSFVLGGGFLYQRQWIASNGLQELKSRRNFNLL